MAKNKEIAKVTHEGFHFRVWINTKEQKVVVDTRMFDTEDIAKTYWLSVKGICPPRPDKGKEAYDELYVISGSFNFDWFNQTSFKVVDKMFSEAIRGYFFDAWDRREPPCDWALNAWIKRKVFEVM